MAEMIFRIPSRTVQYGYVELPVDLEDGSSPELIAAAYVSYVYAFQKEEEATVKRLAKGVSAPEKPSQGATEDQAKRLLDEGLGGVTEVSEDAAPWDKPAVDAKPKPWETEAKATAPAVDLGDDW